MTTITRRYRFSASHRLHSAELSEEENRSLYGKCNHPFGHGHDYLLEVTLGGPVDPFTGLIVPLTKLDGLVNETVLSAFDSRNINMELPQFQTLVPTTENIAKVILGLVEEHWSEYIDESNVQLRRVHIQETDRNGFEILAGASGFDLDCETPETITAHA